ncbi:MAG: hypothetical protein LIV11_11720 [Bacillota bacterium]|nr:hypothetical protein [Bacillota bacterium]
MRVQIPTIVTICAVIIISIMSIAFGILSGRMIRNMAQEQLKTSAQTNILTLQKYLDGMNIYAESLGKEIKL